MQVGRCDYFISTNQVKSDGQRLTEKDLINLGYMAGRYGISLDGDLDRNIKPEYKNDGVKLNINCCTTDLFEDNLEKAGIRFEIIA